MAGSRTVAGAIAVGAACSWLAAGCTTAAGVPADKRPTTLRSYTLSDSGSDVSMMLDLPTFAIDRSKAPASSTFVFGDDLRNGLFVSAAISRSAAQGDCRDFLWERARMNPDFEVSLVAKRNVGELGVFDYDMRAKAGSPFTVVPTQRHVIGCRQAGDRTAYVHVSRVGFVPEDEKLLSSVLAEVYLSRAEGSAAGARVFDMPKGRRLVLDVPLEWWGAVWQPPGELPPTVKLLSRDTDASKLELTALWISPGHADYGTRDDLRERSQRSAEKAVAALGAAAPALQHWDDGDSFGFYYTVTYGDSGLYAYPYMTQGYARVDDIVVPFTISTNTPDDSMIARSLEAMKTARQERL